MPVGDTLHAVESNEAAAGQSMVSCTVAERCGEICVDYGCWTDLPSARARSSRLPVDGHSLQRWA